MDDSLKQHLSTDLAPGQLAPMLGEVTRDRVVVLGRPQAGKTIFLASLYVAGWNRSGDIQIEALNGRTHKAVMETVETLKAGKWPSSTTGSKYLDLSVSIRGMKRPVVSLDYPGEVFRKAFIDGLETEDVQELLEHIDRAAAVLVLLDPAIVEKAQPTVAMDDNFGMLKAIERIRSWPGGESVPIAFVLTKYDKHRELLRKYGGPVEFAKRKYKALLRASGEVAVFPCSVVHDFKSNESPKTVVRTFTPEATLGPLQWIFERLAESESSKAKADKALELKKWLEESEKEDSRRRKRAIALWTAGWALFLVCLAGAGWVAWRTVMAETAPVSKSDSE